MIRLPFANFEKSPMNMQENYLGSVVKQFEYYRMLGTKTIEQLDDKDLFWQANEDCNSIAVLVNHMWGNMLSRWTDFLSSDGEKEWRDRDLEFESVIKTREELLVRWSAGWDCVFEALASVNEENFDTRVYIRDQGHSIVEAVNRQLGHYSYHVGQIVLIGKMIKGSEWQSLSIAKGQSKAFNADKFAQGKHDAHFTDEFLKEEKK